MYSKSSWNGPVDPYIEVVFLNDTVESGSEPVVSLLIFEWKDLDLIGVENPDRPGIVSVPPPPFIPLSLPGGPICTNH
jgi:hypothetical protein